MLSLYTSYFKIAATFVAIVLLTALSQQVIAQSVENPGNLARFTLENDKANTTNYGSTVAVDGNHAVVSNSGWVQFYYYDGEDWVVIHEARISLVESIAIHNGVVVIGFPKATYSRGVADVYELIDEGDDSRTWVFKTKLLSPTHDVTPRITGRFGFNVAVRNNRIAVGEIDGAIADGRKAGVVHMYEKQSGDWTWQTQFEAPPKLPAFGSEYLVDFGIGITFNDDGTELLVSSERFTRSFFSIEGDDDFSGLQAFIYKFSSSDGWRFDTALRYGPKTEVASFKADYTYLGLFWRIPERVSMAFHEDLIAIGMPTRYNGLKSTDLGKVPKIEGAVQLYTRSAGSWYKGLELKKEQTALWRENFGERVEILDGYLAISAPGHQVDGKDQAGSVFIFRGSGSNWNELARIDNPDPQKFSHYGMAMAFDHTGKLLNGVPLHKKGGEVKGRAYMHFVLPTMPVNVMAEDGVKVTSIILDWRKEVGRDGFKVYEKGTGQDIQEIEQIERGSADSYSVSSLTSGTVKELGVSSYYKIDNTTLESPIQWDIGYTRANGQLSGTITSNSGSGMPGALVKADPVGEELQGALFKGGNSLIEIPHRQSLNLDESFTVEAVIRLDGELNQSHVIYSTQSINDDGRFSVELGKGENGSGRLAVVSNFTIRFLEFFPTLRKNFVIQTADNVIQSGTYHHIAYVRDADSHQLYVDGELVAEETNSIIFNNNESPKQIGAGWEKNWNFVGEISEVRLWNTARTEEEINRSKALYLRGNENDLLAYWPLNGEMRANAVDWAGGAHGRLINTGYEVSNAERTWRAYTDTEGKYAIPNIRYAAGGTDFVLTPSFEMHEYDPVSLTRTLNGEQPGISAIDFTDITSFSVSGQVVFEGTTCFAPNVEILVNGVNSGTTDANGNFNVSVLTSGENVIRPVFGEHIFEPSELILNVISNIEGANFSNQQRRTISGQVAGGDCRFSIGEGVLTARGAGSCFIASDTTDTDGNYSFEVPALPLVSLEADVETNPDAEFQVREVNLSDSSATEDFLFRVAPQITISGLPVPTSCGTRVLSQLDNYFLEIEAFEDYGTSGTCPVNNGIIVLNNGIADHPEADTLKFANGIASYEFTAGNPNIVGGGNRPYQKLLSMEVKTGDENDPAYYFRELFDEWAIVEGHRPREQTFTTVSPEIPFFILRDPPGDQSYSFLSEEQSVCRTTGFSTLDGEGKNGWVKAKAGVKFEKGMGISTETAVWGEFGGSLTETATLISQEEFETCLTTNQGFNTSDSDQFTGDDGDLYFGAAMNILYAMTDVLSYNEAACRVDLSKAIVFGNDGFETNYIYTESHIRDVVIPDLIRIRSVPGVSADSVAFLTDQIGVWQQTLDTNRDIKEDVRDLEPLNNFSYAGGTGTEYSLTSTLSKTESIEYSLEIDEEIFAETGFEDSGSGFSTGRSIRMRSSYGESEGSQQTQSNTVGFFLGDDDAGDSFSVDVKSDPVFGTFVFGLSAGTSSCPWEPGTLPRDGTQLAVDSPTQLDVPADQAAAFRLTLGNTGQNDEVREYRLNAIPGTNPDGAIILINGIPIGDLEPYTILPGNSVDQTLTIQKGPSVFDYENLEIVMRSTCDAAIADTVSLTARFENSCSPMAIDFPQEDWIVNAGSGDVLDVNISGYERNAINNILFQYSPKGQNNWVTSRLISTNDLPDNSASLQWDVSTIDDGEYEFRIAVQCDTGTSYTSGVSGSIRRSGLLVEGIASPSDDILSIGEVISVTFNRDIEPSSVINENVKLVDLTTGERIALSYVVSDRTVTITPDQGGAGLQNRLLQASVADVVDLNGNIQVEVATWKFRVRQNPISWNQFVLRQNILLGDGDGTTLTADLTNQSSVEESFTIVTSPEWLDAVTISGTLQPGETQTIAFLPDPLLGTGMYRDTVVAETSLGDEALIVEYGIQCEPPAWELDETSFANSMNLVANFTIDDIPFSNQNDIVAAFVNDELRGVSRVVPTIPFGTTEAGYLYTGFLTIFSNQSSGEEVTFRLWDAAACRAMDIANTLEFQSDAVIGSADSPEQFTVTGAVLQSIPVVSGNNWISLGVEATNMSVNSALSRVRPRDGDVIISQSGFNHYVLGAGWVGRIDSLDPGIMYKLILENDSSLDLIGEPVDGDDRPISVTKGWNWIGYLPDQPLPVSDALASLSHSGDDIIRSQTVFSQYSNNSGMWEGNLSSMSPGAGYKLFRNESGTLTYPGAMDVNNIEMQNMSIAVEPGWEVNAADFEQVMAVTGRLTLGGDVITGDTAWLSAWIDGELRGVTRAVKVLDQWLYFMNVNGESDDDESMIEFKAWHPDLGLYEDLSGAVTFSAEGVVGSPREPIELFGEVATSSEEITNGLPVAFELNQNYPNPFNPTTQIDFALPEASDVRLEIFNVIGQRVSILVNEQRTAGYHNVTFDASSLASGVYFYRIQAGSFVKTQKMMLVK